MKNLFRTVSTFASRSIERGEKSSRELHEINRICKRKLVNINIKAPESELVVVVARNDTF